MFFSILVISIISTLECTMWSYHVIIVLYYQYVLGIDGDLTNLSGNLYCWDHKDLRNSTNFREFCAAFQQMYTLSLNASHVESPSQMLGPLTTRRKEKSNFQYSINHLWSVDALLTAEFSGEEQFLQNVLLKIVRSSSQMFCMKTATNCFALCVRVDLISSLAICDYCWIFLHLMHLTAFIMLLDTTVWPETGEEYCRVMKRDSDWKLLV